MYKKIIADLLLIFVFLVPFRFAILTPSSNNVVSLVCFLATVTGLLIYWVLSFREGHGDGD